MTLCSNCGQEKAASDNYCPKCGVKDGVLSESKGGAANAEQGNTGAKKIRSVGKFLYGFEYKSKANILGWPLLHVSFGFKPNGVPRYSKGIISIGQFGIGLVTISQFGVGLVSVSQFTIAGYAIAQIGLAWDIIAQVGVYVNSGWGQVVIGLGELLRMIS
jgi:hypothetical protein